MGAIRLSKTLLRGMVAIVLISFLGTMIGPLPSAQADNIFLPAPGTLVHLSPEYDPAVLRGIKVNLRNPYEFDFLIDSGDTHWHGNPSYLKSSATKLIKYFLSALTIKDEDMWVNLSPYERNKIVPAEFGITDLGRDLLAQDYVLKQMSSSLLNPDELIGKKYWDSIYKEALKIYGTTSIPVKTFHKIWIVPDKAVIYENKGVAFIGKSHLKVLLEQDYLAQTKNLPTYSKGNLSGDEPPKGISHDDLSTGIMRNLLLPVVEKEVNEGKNFSLLRQCYNSIILAAWYKKRLKESILSQIYVGKGKINGIDIADKNARERIYHQYLRAFKKGVFNFIKEEYDISSNATVPRKYFSGGTLFDKAMLDHAMSFKPLNTAVAADYAQHSFFDVKTKLDSPFSTDRAMAVKFNKKGSRVSQDQLEDVYWKNGAVHFERILNEAKKFAESVRAGTMSIEDREKKIKVLLKQAVENAASELGQGQEKVKIEELRNRFISEIENGSPQQSYAISMSTWFGEVMLGKTPVGFPRDAGHWFVGIKALGLLLGKNIFPGLFYLSGQNETFSEYYSWMSGTIVNLAKQSNSQEELLNKLIKEIENKEKHDKKFSDKMKTIKAILEANFKKSGTINEEDILFIDTGFKTFPVMFAALLKKWYPKKKASALVQASGLSLEVLSQLDPNQWREHVKQYILSHDTAKYATANFGHSEDANNFLKHPVIENPFGMDPNLDALYQMLTATSEATQFEAFWDQLCFIRGSITYWDLLEGITGDIKKQGVPEEKAGPLAHEAIQEGMGIVNVTDPNGVQISAMPTIFKETVPAGEKVTVVKQTVETKETEKEVEPAFTPQEMVQRVEALLQEKLKDTVPDFKLSDRVRNQFENVVDNKTKAIDAPVIEQHNTVVREQAKKDNSKPPTGTPSGGNQTVTLFDADPYVSNLANYNANENFNGEITKRKWYNPKKWWLGMTETANVELRAMDRTSQLRALINEGRASAITGELGLNSADELTSSESGILADIASRDFNLSNEYVSTVTDPDVVAKIKTLFLDFIKGSINDAEFETRVRVEIAPALRKSTGASAIGSNLLRKAKAIKQDLLNQNVNIQQLQDLNITVNFANLKHAFIQAREVNGWWNKAIVKTMNTLQTLPIRQIPVLGALTSPGFVGFTMSVAGQAVAAGSRMGAKALAVGGLTGILLPILGTPALIAMGIAVALAGVVSAFRENGRMWKNLSLLEIREALDAQSDKLTAVEEKMLNNGAVVDKLRVSTAMDDLDRLTKEYNTTPGMTQRHALEEAVADILARVDYGYENSAEFFKYDTDRFIQQESQRKALLDKVREAVNTLGIDRNAVVTSSNYAFARKKLATNYNQSLKKFSRIKLRQVLTASAISMGIALVFSFLSGLIAHWVTAWFQHGGSSTTAGLAGTASTTKTVNVSLSNFINTNTDKINVNEMRQALIDGHVSSPDEVMRELIKGGKVDGTALLKRVTEGGDKNLAGTLEKFLDQRFGVNIHFGSWSSPEFISNIWKDPNVVKELHNAGITNVDHFKQAFEQKVTDPHHGAWSLYGSLKEILKTNSKAKKAETIMLNALSRTDESRGNLADYMRTHGFLRTEDSVRHFFSNQNGTRSLLERYSNYVVDQKSYSIFLHNIKEIYAQKGPNHDWTAMGRQIESELNKLNSADRNNIIFDVVHRYEGWNPHALTGKATGDFVSIFTDSHREAAVMSVQIPASTPTPSAIPVQNPYRLGPVVTGGPLSSLGILGKKVKKQIKSQQLGVKKSAAAPQVNEQGLVKSTGASKGQKDLKGGIDMNTRGLNLDIKGDGSIKFHIDRSQLDRFKDISGFKPDVVRITPVHLTTFLGIAQHVSVAPAGNTV